MVFWFPEPRTGIGLFLFYLHELTALSQTYVGKLILCVSIHIYTYMSYMCMSHMKYMLYIFAFIVYTLRYPQISWGPGVMFQVAFRVGSWQLLGDLVHEPEERVMIGHVWRGGLMH